MARCIERKGESKLHALIKSNQPELLATHINQNFDFDSSCYIVINEKHVLPVDFTQTDLEQVVIHKSKSEFIQFVKLRFSDSHSNGSDFLLCEQTDYEDNYGNEVHQCHLYFSRTCTKDMAATSYYLTQALSMIGVLTFSKNTHDKLASCLIKRYGQTLVPKCTTDFWNKQLDSFRMRSILEVSQQDDSATLREEIERLMQSKYNFVSCEYNTANKNLNILYTETSNNSFGLVVVKESLQIKGAT
ncbi:hypothetical protein DPMN_099382 [Dreissena polymorpha]|uniref:Uncharacterized protein n=1 Tax=Dreissena polymorpha TaxID=45954 RepID=A0A9D4CDC5_DREPO|nr:hypothetical protein DPMN_059561 [Dreissena polymorpha]KAH3721599.1 hypothetical protein DPMN_064529 [Dreissena polymorpha]KAH3848666.1 hypothetical protein DPMN_091046 [Dreissena polymorpha]KAH3856787.1 hypothetical protein DPMN_099382 [Dreissena polymorpha]